MRRHTNTITKATGSAPVGFLPLGGGCVSDVRKVTLADGRVIVAKSGAAGSSLDLEGFMLRYLSETGGLPVPEVLYADDELLLMNWIESAGGLSDGAQIQAADLLAALHDVSADSFGFDRATVIGGLHQPNDENPNWVDFFRDQRLRPQQELARKSGKLPVSTDKTLSKLCDRLENYLDISGEKPALLHGDLWSGNYFPDRNQVPCIFDPAVYFGLREADLAMTELFGRLPQKFYDAYHEVFPLNPGYDERKYLYNLYHLLNHLNIFC